MKYWAFISYSHADEAWATWLHRALETWRVPRRLVGRPLGTETIPARLFPVFRDRDELPSSHELGAVINRALADSRNLIVVCSPRAATSRWVNEEIKAFRALARGNRVFCLIVDGEPHASARPDIAFSECFPPALREGGFEPIAADARPGRDGKEGARLKLLAGLLDLGLDELRQREKQRQFRQRVVNGLSVLAVVGVLGGTVQWFMAQRAERERQLVIEQLVESGRQELLDARPARAAHFLTEALARGHDTPVLRFMLGQAMRTVDSLTPVRIRHRAENVRRAVFSPDGSRVVLLLDRNGAGEARVYDAATGNELIVLEEAPPYPRIVQFLPDGKHLLVTGYQIQNFDLSEAQPRSVLWSLDQPRPRLSLPGISGRFGRPTDPEGRRLAIAGVARGIEVHDLVNWNGGPPRLLASDRAFAAVSFSPDGTLLATGDREGHVQLFAANRFTARKALTGFEGKQLVALDFSPDGKLLFAVSSAGDLRFWDVATGTLAQSFAADLQFVSELRFNSSGTRFLTVGSEGYKVWSTARGMLLFSLPRILSISAGAALSADGNFLYTADNASNVSEIWSVRSRLRVSTLEYHTGRLSAAVLDGKGERLLLASADGSAAIWRVGAERVWDQQFLGELPIRARFLPDGRLISGAGWTDRGAAYIHDIRDGRREEILGGHSAFVNDVAVTADGARILTASADGTARIWSGVPGARTAKVLDHGGRPLQFGRFSPDGSRALTLATHYSEGLPAAVLWDATTGAVVADLAHAGIVNTYDFSADGKYLVTAGDDTQVRVWNAATGVEVRVLHGHLAPVWSAQFSRDGTRLLTAGADGRVRLWNAANGAVLQELADPALGLAYTAVFSPDERQIAAGTQAGDVWIWQPESGDYRAMKGHTSDVFTLRFIADGNVLLSSGYDGTVRAWDPMRGEQMALLAAPGGHITGMELNPVLSSVAAVTQTGYVGVWPVDPEPRQASQLRGALACQTSFRFDDTRLIPAAPGGCGPNQ